MVLGGFSHAGDYAAAAVIRWNGSMTHDVEQEPRAEPQLLRRWSGAPRLGVGQVFGVSGANIEDYDAIYRLGEGELVSVPAKTSGAAFMAMHRRVLASRSAYAARRLVAA